MSEDFDAKKFIDVEIEKTRRNIGKEKAIVAVSGGVDSTTCAVLTHKAIGENLVCVILDDAFMREGEPEYVRDTLSASPFDVPIKIVNVGQEFLQAMKDLHDAEEKRKVFREVFYKTLKKAAMNEGCRVLVQGTIRADIIETVGGVKTQHNVLEQMGIDPLREYGFKVVEPLITLFKSQVRQVARSLGIPPELSERQPFPGPGLSVRIVGEIKSDKLEALKKATSISEENLAQHSPSQYFAVIVDDEEESNSSEQLHIQETVARFLNVPSRNVLVKVFRDRATGVQGGRRHYGKIVGLRVQTVSRRLHQTGIQSLVALQAKIVTRSPAVSRVFYGIGDRGNRRSYVVGVRSVQTSDFLTAKVSEIPWGTLNATATQILDACPNVSAVYYDVTPKPPATIEME